MSNADQLPVQNYEESGVGVESVPLGEGLDLFTLRNRKLRALGSPLVYKGELKVRLVHARGLRMKDSVLKGAGQLFGNDTKPNTYGVLQVHLIIFCVVWLWLYGGDIREGAGSPNEDSISSQTRMLC